MGSLSGASVIVTGATGGIGSRVSTLLADAGVRLTLQGQDAGRLASLGLAAERVAGDLRDPDTATATIEAAVAAYGGIDGLIVASGVVAFGPVIDLPDQALQDLFAINTLAPIRLLRASVPHLTASAEAGREPFVVQFSAVVAEHPTAGMAAYSASKAALTAYDTAAARELRRAGIRIIDARPPHTETGLAQRPIAGEAPTLRPGLDPAHVAARVLAAIRDDERDLPSTSFS